MKIKERSRTQARGVGKRANQKAAARSDVPQAADLVTEDRATRPSNKINGRQKPPQRVVRDETAESGDDGEARADVNGKRPAKKPSAQDRFRLGYLVHDVSRMRRTLLDQHMRPLGITRSQYWVLGSLSRQGTTGTMSTELAKLLDVGKVTIGGLIDRLEIAGYVYRRGDKDDRRAKRIFITETGYALIERMKSVLIPLNDSLCKGLTADDIANTERTLAMIRTNIRDQLVEDPVVSEDPAEHIS